MLRPVREMRRTRVSKRISASVAGFVEGSAGNGGNSVGWSSKVAKLLIVTNRVMRETLYLLGLGAHDLRFPL
jgi:hypothetical protein